MFENEFNRLMSMTKAEIISEGVQRGFWASRPQTATYLQKKWSKTLLARTVADRIDRMEKRGY